MSGGTIVETDTGCIEGSVYYADGKRAAAVSIILHDLQDTSPQALGKREIHKRLRKTYTDMDGFYKFDSLGNGLYFIESNEFDTLGALKSATIGEHDSLVSQDLVLDRCGAIIGKIDTNNLNLYSKVAIYLPEVDRLIRVDSAGAFTIPNLPAGDYQLLVESIDSNSQFTKDSIKVPVSAGSTTDLANLGLTIFQETSFELSKDSNTVALWNFNQLKDSIIPDESGNNNNGSIFGATKLISADWGTGLSLSDGCGIKVRDAASLQLSNFEIIARVFPTQFTKRNNILAKEPIGSAYPGGYVLMFDNYGHITGYIRDAAGWTAVQTLSPVQPNKWYLIKLRKTIDTVSLFVDDILISSKPVAVDPGTEVGNMGIGYDINEVTDRYFRGYIDAIRIDNLKGSGVNTGLIASWTFDSYGDSTYYDVTGHGFDAFSKGYSLSLVPGIKGKALDCSQDRYYVAIRNSYESFNFKNFSIEGWINLRNDSLIADSNKCIIGQQYWDYDLDTFKNAWGIYINVAGKADFRIADSLGSTCYDATSLDALKENEWFFIVAAFDSKTLKIYVNGNLENTTTYSGGIFPQTTTNATVGCQVATDTTFNDYFNGLLDELKLYNYLLPEDTIQAHYDALKPYFHQ